MACSQCHTGRAWDERGRCRPCSIGNVDLGSPFPPLGAAPASEPVEPGRARLPGAAPVATDPAQPPAVHTPARPAPPVACSQCWVGRAWDDEGRCRPCSDGGVRLVPLPSDETEEPTEAAADPGRPRWSVLRGRRWFGAARS